MIDKFYPKIETLFKRDKDTFRVTDEYRVEEMEMFKFDALTFQEKIDGMNIRVWYDGVGGKVEFSGRSNRAELPGRLVTWLHDNLTVEKLKGIFGAEDVVLFGEGYGSGIQKGGLYGEEQRFILFDVMIGNWWLKDDDVRMIGAKSGLDIKVPEFYKFNSIRDMVNHIKEGLDSKLGSGKVAEGVVIRPRIPVCKRDGSRLIAKLKTKDYKGGK